MSDEAMMCSYRGCVKAAGHDGYCAGSDGYKLGCYGGFHYRPVGAALCFCEERHRSECAGEQQPFTEAVDWPAFVALAGGEFSYLARSNYGTPQVRSLFATYAKQLDELSAQLRGASGALPRESATPTDSSAASSGERVTRYASICAWSDEDDCYAAQMVESGMGEWVRYEDFVARRTRSGRADTSESATETVVYGVEWIGDGTWAPVLLCDVLEPSESAAQKRIGEQFNPDHYRVVELVRRANMPGPAPALPGPGTDAELERAVRLYMGWPESAAPMPESWRPPYHPKFDKDRPEGFLPILNGLRRVLSGQSNGGGNG